MGVIQLLRIEKMGQNTVIVSEAVVIEMAKDVVRFFAGWDELLDQKLSKS